MMLRMMSIFLSVVTIRQQSGITNASTGMTNASPPKQPFSTTSAVSDSEQLERWGRWGSKIDGVSESQQRQQRGEEEIRDQDGRSLSDANSSSSQQQGDLEVDKIEAAEWRNSQLLQGEIDAGFEGEGFDPRQQSRRAQRMDRSLDRRRQHLRSEHGVRRQAQGQPDEILLSISYEPTATPSQRETLAPTEIETGLPTLSTFAPTQSIHPSAGPSSFPSLSWEPSSLPTVTFEPTFEPSSMPSFDPTTSFAPTVAPTAPPRGRRRRILLFIFLPMLAIGVVTFSVNRGNVL